MSKSSMSVSKNIIVFFTITFAFSWILWFPFVLAGLGLYEMSDLLASLMLIAVMLGAFGPMLSAVILTYKKGKWTSVKAYFRRCFRFRINYKLYILAILFPLIVTVIAHYFTIWTGIADLPTTLLPSDISIPVYVLVIPYFILMLTFGGGQEEFGWRGYVQDPLQEKFGIIRGSMILGFFWGLWHLPLWLMPGEGHENYPFIAFILFTIIFSVMIGILYNVGKKKMVIPWVMHAISNTAVPVFPVLFLDNVPQPGYWIWVIVNFIFTTGLVIWFIKRNQPEMVEKAL